MNEPRGLSILALTLVLSTFGLSTPLVAADALITAIKQPTYAEVVNNLEKAAIPVRQLGTKARVAVTPAAGRIFGLAFSAESENLLWTNPQLSDTRLVRETPEKLVGGIGGDRLWFSPELDYHWVGEPNWKTFENYKVPAASDPGAYRFAEQDGGSIVLRAAGELPVHGSPLRVGFEVERTIRLTKPPLSSDDPLMKGMDYVGIETTNRVKFADATHQGRLDLWHLLQVPVGSVLVVPLKSSAEAAQKKPLSYGNPGGWHEKKNLVLWRYQGKANAKFGLSAAALTGRSAVLRPLGTDRWLLIVRQFPVEPDARYCDHPYKVPRNDQAFQAWDGFGFGEMEFHNVALDAQHGPREFQELDQLWAFGGSTEAIEKLAARLLGESIENLLR